jgi:WbqC-like protein family
VAKTVAIVQSSYIPWKGYFDLIRSADEFIFFDDVQYTRRDWRNRNRIKTSHGLHWLSIPVQTKGQYLGAIKDIEVVDSRWALAHWKTIEASYGRTPHFKRYRDLFVELYSHEGERMLVDIDQRFVRAICGILGIVTRITRSSDYELCEGRAERIVSLCRQAGATRYLSGPSAREYLEPSAFSAAGIELSFADYAGYPEYRQLHPPFEHQVSVIDLIFNEGPDAARFMLEF